MYIKIFIAFPSELWVSLVSSFEYTDIYQDDKFPRIHSSKENVILLTYLH